jgi:diguanylate cyclase (GGDEF)-like protein
MRIGREANSEISLEHDGVSRRHARIEQLEGRFFIMDASSTNGTLLNGAELDDMVELKNGDLIKVGPVILKYLSAADLEAALHEQIYQNTITDHRTHLYNERYFHDMLERECSRSRRHQRPLSALFMDIDYFKRVNDRHGHHVGDIALAATAGTIRSCLRTEDTVARYGGEEIVALLPETELAEAAWVGEKVRVAVEQNQIRFRDQVFSVTISIGCAVYEAHDTTPDDFVGRADAKVYEAKRGGRNCIRF